MWNQYYTVDSLDAAIDLLAQHQERARIIAGATDLIIEMERQQRPSVDILIDISRVSGLNQIQHTDDQIILGPLVTHNQIILDDGIRNFAWPLVQAAWEVGAPQIRNRATIAGNLITASPANDTIPPLQAMGASVTLKSIRGERVVPLSQFYTGLRTTDLQTDEVMSAIAIPKMQPHQRGTFIKLGLRRAQAISVVNIAAMLTLDDDQIVNASVAYGSVAPTILQATELESFLRGKQLNDETIVAAATLAATIPTPIDDVRATAGYRSEMVKILTARALRQIRDNQLFDHVPANPAMLQDVSQRNGQFQPALHNDDADNSLIHTTVNGQEMQVSGGFNRTLLDFLRDECKLPGTKSGCSEGECGACTVFLDGMAVMSCMVPAPRAHHASIVTIEGLADEQTLHPVQSAFIETGAVQCGFCTPGFLMSAAMLLEEHPDPTHEQILQSISGNLCRCTGYYKIVEAVQKASVQMRSQNNG